jgi:hypothetical protein
MGYKNKYQSGLILYRKEKEEIFDKIFNEVLNLYKLRNGKIMGHCGSVGKMIRGVFSLEGQKEKFRGFQVNKDFFWRYADFDSFLIELGQILDDIDNIGMVIGHTDSMGFMWLDYNNFNYARKEIVEIRNKFTNINSAQ